MLVKPFRIALCALALAASVGSGWAQQPAGATPVPEAAPAQPPGGAGTGDISPAERAVLTNHLQNAQQGTTLEYRYTHRGTLDEPFDDTVKLIVLPADAAQTQPGGRPTAVAFLSGARRAASAPVGDPTGNPVILHFFERDTQELQRITGGRAGYHKRKILIALAEDKTVEPVEIEWEGKKVPARRVTITPFQDFADPDLKPKYGPMLGKRYEIVLSDAIPGTLYSMRAFVPGGDKPVVDDTLTFVGVKQGVPPPAAPAAPPPASATPGKPAK
jgi:hypothetical protein